VFFRKIRYENQENVILAYSCSDCETEHNEITGGLHVSIYSKSVAYSKVQ